MLVSTTGSFQLVHSRGVGGWGGGTPEHPGATQVRKWNEGQQTNKQKQTKKLQSDNLLTPQSAAEFKLRTPKLNIKKS